MTPVLLTGPAVEPVTLADMKTWLRLDDDGEDRLVASLITASRLMVEAESGRCLVQQTWRLLLDRWPVSGFVRLPVTPVIGVEAVRVCSAMDFSDPSTLSISWTPLPAGSFSVEGAGGPDARLVVHGSPPTPVREQAGIEIDVLAGYGACAEAVPQPLRQAVRTIVARWYEQRGDADGGTPALPREALALIAPYRRLRM